MKKDIQIPKAKEVYIAVVQEEHLEYKTLDWNAYIINDSDEDLDTVLIVSKGYSDKQITPPMRHSIAKLPARSYAKIEYMQEQVLALTPLRLPFFRAIKCLKKHIFLEKTPLMQRPYNLYR